MSQKPEQVIEFECECTSEKRIRAIFDGGNSGYYSVDYCQSCFDGDDKQFLISMENIHV